jgi:hypothetical protein
MDKCHILQSLLKNGPNQTILSYPAVEGSSLVPVSSRFNQLACRKALAVYIVLDEKPLGQLREKDLNTTVIRCSLCLLFLLGGQLPGIVFSCT